MFQILKIIDQRVHENEVTSNQLMLHSNLNSSLVLQLTPCMALYDTMLSLKSPIGTHCLGFAFNLAGFILAAGEKVLLVNIGFLFGAYCLEYALV